MPSACHVLSRGIRVKLQAKLSVNIYKLYQKLAKEVAIYMFYVKLLFLPAKYISTLW